MAIQPTYPGVYIEEIPSDVRTITGVSTSIAAFIDYFKRGPMNKAVQIFNFGDFERIFGGLDSKSEASYAIDQFFMNGGGQAFVVRVAGGTPAVSSVQIGDSVNGTAVLSIEAISEGSWGDNIGVKIEHALDGNDQNKTVFSMLVTEYSDRGDSLRQERFLNLSMLTLEDVINGESKIIRVKKEGGNFPLSNGTTSGEHSDIININGTQLNVTINGTTAKATLENVSGGKAINDVARALEEAIRSAVPTKKEFSAATVKVVNKRFHILAGGNTPDVLVTFGKEGADTAAADLLLLPDTDDNKKINANVQEYRLREFEFSAIPFPAKVSLQEWKAQSSYKMGEIVIADDNHFHLNLAQHTSSESFENDKDKWYKISISTIPDWSNDDKDINIGDVVKEDSKYYQSNIEHKTGGFKSEIANWKEVTEGESDGWEKDKYYDIGELIKNDSGKYQCIIKHKSGTFAAESANWEEVTEIPVEFVPNWDKDRNYKIGDIVKNDSKFFKAKTESTNKEPKDNLAEWVITNQFIFFSIWNENDEYNSDVIVKRSSKVYKSLSDENKNNDPSKKENKDHWKDITNIITSAPSWDINKEYKEEDVTSRDNKIYKSQIAHNKGFDPSAQSTPPKWELIGSFNNPTAQIAGFSGNDGTLPGAEALIYNKLKDKKGLYALEDVDLFNILCIPFTAMMYPDNEDEADFIITRAIEYCEQKRAFFIMDTPNNIRELPDIQSWIASKTNLRSDYAALYFPRLDIADPLNKSRLRSFGASGTMAGLYARTDAERGVWKAPAGTDTNLRNVSQLSYKLTDSENGVLNPIAVNCLRTFPIHGNISWGGRTLAGADAMASQWKYIPVRRLALFIEESLYRGTQWVVFEPNDEPLWAQIRLNVGAFMNNLFRQGAFQGTNKESAYAVQCNEETTTQNDRDLGIVNVIVGFAPLKPAEFVFIKIKQLAGQILT